MWYLHPQPETANLQVIQSLQCPMGADGPLESSGTPLTRVQGGGVPLGL